MKWYKAPQGSTVMYRMPNSPMRLIRYAYYAFVFSIPFDAADIGIGSGLGALSRLLGFMCVMVALLQPSLCFRLPPKAFWCFAGYLYIFVLMIFYMDLNRSKRQSGDCSLFVSCWSYSGFLIT